MKKFFIILALFFGVTPLTFGWNAAGHQRVAQIAYEQLTPSARHQVDDLLNHEFVKASTWADQVRAQGNDTMNTWHYINLPDPGPQKNVVDAIIDSEKILADSHASKAQKQQALRGLIHWVGDIHQPLHTIGRDRGGTLFKLTNNPYGKNLHQLWDNGAGLLQNNQWKTATITFTTAQLSATSPMQWAEEGYQIASTQAYIGITPNTVPNSAYIERSQSIVQQQIALAGMRLAQILNQL